MLLTGAFLFLCDAIYAQLLPTPALTIRFEDTLLFFRYGWCFWMILTAGWSPLNSTSQETVATYNVLYCRQVLFVSSSAS